MRRGLRGTIPCAQAAEIVGRLDNASYQYPGTTAPAVAAFTLTLKRGECLALVGANGSGKSTVVKLLLGLLAPTSGYVSPVQRAGIVLQEFGRYPLNLRENIGIGRSTMMHATSRIRDRLRAVHVELELNTRLGRVLKKSTDVSGGQWQRIALARALLSDAPVLILDEPTSSLDPIAEAQLYQEFDGVVGERTVVLVTHRLAAARLADRIAVMDHGRLVELGSHRDLVAASGLYARMWHVQGEWAR